MITMQKDLNAQYVARVDLGEKRVLNAGCGPKSIRKIRTVFEPKNWREIRMDVDPNVAPDFVGTMTDMSEHFAARCFHAVWSSHSLEHLHSHEIPRALAEFRRVLRDDGFALISCPDLETVMTLFLERGPNFTVYQSPAGPVTPLDMMFGHSPSIASGNLHMAHHSGLTAELLGGLMLQAGFSEVVTKRQHFDLWALALTEEADRDDILRHLRNAGLDMSDSAK